MTERGERDIQVWLEKILRGDPLAVSRAITSVEIRDGDAHELLRRLFPHTGHAKIIGVTGPTGSGKSSLVEGLIALLRKRGKTVGVLAVDPSSPFTGGAILGDRIRMQEHTSDPGAYIRSMATRGSLGGVASTTLDAALVLDASGKEFVLVETVGVGQDEVEIAKLADVTLVLLVPGLGDDVQAFKAGIMEIADIFVINKADLPGAARVEQEVQALLSLTHSAGEWQPPIIKTIATRHEGVEQLLEAIISYLEFTESHGNPKERRVQHWRERLMELLRERMFEEVIGDIQGNGALNQYATAVASREEDPYEVVDRIIKGQKKKLAGMEQNIEGWTGSFALDHLGVAVQSLAEAVDFYQRVLGLEVSGIHIVPQEKTKVAMMSIGESRIELLEPTEPDSPIGRFLAMRGEGLHHICIRVPDLGAMIARLNQFGVKLINPEPDIGAGGHQYVFVHPHSTGGVLLELVQSR